MRQVHSRRDEPTHGAVRGFTLIELVLVIVIIGALAAVALPRFINIGTDAERATVEGWVGALRSAQQIAFSASVVAGAGYTSADQISLFNLVRCDRVATLGAGGGQPWQGHQLALAPLRETVFSDADANACSGNTISFTTKGGRTVTITGNNSGIAWAAVPAY